MKNHHCICVKRILIIPNPGTLKIPKLFMRQSVVVWLGEITSSWPGWGSISKMYYAKCDLSGKQNVALTQARSFFVKIKVIFSGFYSWMSITKNFACPSLLNKYVLPLWDLCLCGSESSRALFAHLEPKHLLRLNKTKVHSIQTNFFSCITSRQVSTCLTEEQ